MISSDLKSAYDNFYEASDYKWRMLSAKFKAQHIVDICKGRQFTRVLEVGAGDGSILHFLDAWHFAPELHALEISESGVTAIRSRNLASVKSVGIFDGYAIPFGDDEFDLVILSHVLEHVEFERLLLREIKRVSKFQVIEVPKDYRFGVDKRMKHFLDYGHINMYTPSSLRFLLQSEGLEILGGQVSMISPEVTKFNTFVNQKKPKSLARALRINLEYRLKKMLSALAGQKKQEDLANAYTVLTQKMKDFRILST
ncbi:methyltransferase domain-containing protein [Pedobacter sp. HMF7056]|uniref:Methyltransferase domain-containing protein n=2 Tax=Hufsiella ginkgonis TaxID=2695274 RepID=A0A7K1Y390_9SPHI|nr:methyltransferase domain-containing protein [Hufsiella ginkgonis]